LGIQKGRSRAQSRRARQYDNESCSTTCFASLSKKEDRFENGSPAYHAFYPGLKGCHTWGHTPEDALANIRNAPELYVEDLIGGGDLIPGPRACC
jgi:predicted RNase H-like HicB family nuclease